MLRCPNRSSGKQTTWGQGRKGPRAKMGGEPSAKGQVPELIFICGRSMSIGSSVCRSRNRSSLFSEFRVIGVFSFGVNVVELFPSNGVMTARFPDESIQSKLHVEESILKDFGDSRRGERGESRGRMYVGSREGTIDNPESV